MKRLAYIAAGAAALVFASVSPQAQAAPTGPNVVAMAPIPNPPEKPHGKHGKMHKMEHKKHHKMHKMEHKAHKKGHHKGDKVDLSKAS